MQNAEKLQATDKQNAIQLAIYKSGKEKIFFSDMPEILAARGLDMSVTKQEFLTAIQEFAEYNYHLIIGGRKSENPGLILYGNLHKPRNKDRGC